MRVKLVCLSLFIAVLLEGRSVSRCLADPLLPFQGYLDAGVSNGGKPLNGVRLVQFKIFDAPVAGRVLWPGEIHKLSVNQGLVNTILGSKVSLAGVDFGEPTYLEITPDAGEGSGGGDDVIDASDPPLLPRQIILPAVFAVGAQHSRKLLDGQGEPQDWSVVFGSNNPSSGTFRTDKIGVNSIPSDRLMPLSADKLPEIPAEKLPEIPPDKLIGNSIPFVKLQNRKSDSSSVAGAGEVAVGLPIDANGLTAAEGHQEDFFSNSVTIRSTGRPMWVGLVGLDHIELRSSDRELVTCRFLILNGRRTETKTVVASKLFNTYGITSDPVQLGATGMAAVLVDLEAGQDYTFTPAMRAIRSVNFSTLSGMYVVAYEL